LILNLPVFVGLLVTGTTIHLVRSEH